MTDYRSSRIHEDLGPSATSALAVAYDSALQPVRFEAAELRYSLARHLMSAAFAGERDPDLLRVRASTYVQKWFDRPRSMAA